jgi:hypothetical protein
MIIPITLRALESFAISSCSPNIKDPKISSISVSVNCSHVIRRKNRINQETYEDDNTRKQKGEAHEKDSKKICKWNEEMMSEIKGENGKESEKRREKK